MIDKRSRYAKVGTYEAPGADGSPLVTLELRTPARGFGVFLHQPVEGERLDHLAQTYYRDPRLFWRIADAGDVLDPFDLVSPGVPVRIPPSR